MHTQEKQQKFIEHRAQGWTYLRISSELNVARSTLHEWSRKFRFEIQNRCAMEMEDLQHRLVGSKQHRASQLAERLSRIEQELKQRSLADVSTARLFTLAEHLRRLILNETSDFMFVSPVKDIPQDEYVEEVQRWNP